MQQPHISRHRYLPRGLRRHRANLMALLVSSLFFTIFFFPGLFRGYFYLAGDPLVYLLPLRTVAWEMIRQGTLPLWTPTILSGYPLLSMANLGLGYPLTWGYLVLPGHYAEQIYQLAPYLLSSFFTFYYVRQLGRSATAALLAALSFSYGGLMISLVGSYGFWPNGGMWLPLMLVGIERTRTDRFLSGVLLTTGAFAMSVLSGVGQSFTMLAALSLCYAAFLSLAVPAEQVGWLTLRRWHPVIALLSALMLGAGIAAFQILETMPAVALSVRARLPYEIFTEGSFPLLLLLKSFLEPLHNAADSTAYVPLLAVIMALIAVAGMLTRRMSDQRILFWAIIAAVSFVLMMGAFTPLYRLMWYVPFLNRFRVPSRHSFEWSFALSILAAWGWDASLRWTKRFRLRPLINHPGVMMVVCTGILLAGGVTGAAWWRAMCAYLPSPCLTYGELHASYLGWKVLYFAITVAAMIAAWQLASSTRRNLFLMLAIALGCFIEPFIQIAHLSAPLSFSADRFARRARTTEFLRQFPPAQNRIYSQIGPAEAHSPVLKVDPPNLTAPAGLHNVAGYEPLLPERYSRALNSTDWNEVNRTPFLRQDHSLFEPQSHVLDLLNTTHVVAYSGLRMEPEKLRLTNGIGFTPEDLSLEVKTETPVVLEAGNQFADSLALVTTLANSVTVADETVIAFITIHTTEGKIISWELRAGRDTAEWAHERADVLPVVKHRLAPVFDRRAGDEQNSFSACRYFARLSLGEPLRVRRVEIRKVVEQPTLMLWKASVLDSTTNASASLTSSPLFVSALDAQRWQVEYEQDGAVILRNNRALPRAWLVAEAVAVTEREAWQRIRGQSADAFDPRRTALLEIESGRMPRLPGGAISADASVRIIDYAPNRLMMETLTDHAALLVVSEMYYPGWVATIDGTDAEIFQTNYLLRSVLVPPGRRRVEMRYTAPQARRGAFISLASLLLTIGLNVMIFSRRKRQPDSPAIVEA